MNKKELLQHLFIELKRKNRENRKKKFSNKKSYVWPIYDTGK